MRVQIPAYTDHWMRGDRFGEIVRTTAARPANSVRAALLTKNPHGKIVLAHVKLDKSGKTVAVILDDCTVIEEGPTRLTEILNGRA